MTILYTYFVSAISIDTALQAVLEVRAIYPHLVVKADTSGDASALWLRSAGAEALLRARPLSEKEEEDLRHIGIFHGVITFSVPQVTPENVGLCWDTLLATVLTEPSMVWLSERMYPSRSIAPFASIRNMRLWEQVPGHILEPDELIRFAEGRR